MSQFYSAIKWVLGSTQVALICRGNFKGDTQAYVLRQRRRQTGLLETVGDKLGNTAKDLLPKIATQRE